VLNKQINFNGIQFCFDGYAKKISSFEIIFHVTFSFFPSIIHDNAFFIGIPDDEPVDSKDAHVEANISEENNVESFNYFLSLLTDLDKKNNLLDLKEYNKAFLAF
jgi:hypothetical protein